MKVFNRKHWYLTLQTNKGEMKMSQETQPNQNPDYIVPANAVHFAPFNIPGFSGDTEAATVNDDVTRAPFVVLLKMQPGATLKKHYHPRIGEVLYVLEGEFINDGQRLPAGSFIAHGAGVVHGPHTTETGCTMMFIQSAPVGPDDSLFVD